MKAKVLYIEDNTQNFYLVNFILTAAGFEVVWAKDGHEGVEKAALGWADLILLDIQLPGMDGYAVAQALRGNPALSSTPIVALTSYAMAGDREKALAAGCTGYIEKPIDPAAFAAQVEQHLLAAKSKDEAP
jgi:two-component system cell cycle response regulator DivK